MLLIGILVYLIFFTGLMFLIAKVAPFGYEDEHGFHLGKEQEKNTGSNNLAKKFVGIENRAA